MTGTPLKPWSDPLSKKLSLGCSTTQNQRIVNFYSWDWIIWTVVFTHGEATSQRTSVSCLWFPHLLSCGAGTQTQGPDSHLNALFTACAIFFFLINFMNLKEKQVNITLKEQWLIWVCHAWMTLYLESIQHFYLQVILTIHFILFYTEEHFLRQQSYKTIL